MAALIRLLSIFPATIPRGRRAFFCRLGLALAVSLAPCSMLASRTEVEEPAIKAAGLFKIISFVEWPPEAFASPTAPLVVGVLGSGPIADLLPAFAENETWHGRRVVLRGLPSAALAHECHVVFIARSAQTSWPYIRHQFARRPILVVSDASQFARAGGTVQLAIARNRLHLVINLGAVRSAGITISSKVLRLAEIVGDARP